VLTLAADAVLMAIFLLISAAACYLIWLVLFRADRLSIRNDARTGDQRSAAAETRAPASRTALGQDTFPRAAADTSAAKSPLAEPRAPGPRVVPSPDPVPRAAPDPSPAKLSLATPVKEEKAKEETPKKETTKKETTPFSNEYLALLVILSHFTVEVGSGEIKIFPIWKNDSAQTAIILGHSVEWNTYTGDPPRGFALPERTGVQESLLADDGASRLIHAQESRHYESISIPASTMDAVRSGEQRLFIWGYIQYEDFPKGNARRRSEFTREMVITESASDDQGNIQVSAAFRMFGPYNSVAALEQPEGDITRSLLWNSPRAI
jgi:hypothetical protein